MVLSIVLILLTGEFGWECYVSFRASGTNTDNLIISAAAYTTSKLLERGATWNVKGFWIQFARPQRQLARQLFVTSYPEHSATDCKRRRPDQLESGFRKQGPIKKPAGAGDDIKCLPSLVQHWVIVTWPYNNWKKKMKTHGLNFLYLMILETSCTISFWLCTV